MREGRNGKTWIAVGGLAVALLVFLTGWWGGTKTAWERVGAERKALEIMEKRLTDLEAWRIRQDDMYVDVGIQISNAQNQVVVVRGECAAVKDSMAGLRQDVNAIRDRLYDRPYP